MRQCRDRQRLPYSAATDTALGRRLIRRSVHKSVQALEADIRKWVGHWNENPRPFTWTKTADEILHSLAEYLAKISAGQPEAGQK